MKTVGTVALGMALLCTAAAVWLPQLWWQLAVTAMLLLVLGILMLTADKQ
jgi:hypothetical protein